MPPTGSDWPRWWRIATVGKSMCGGRGSFWPQPRAAARRRSCAARGVEAERVALARAVHAQGVAGLLRDKTRKPGLPPLPPTLVDRVVELTRGEPPGEATHWTGRAMATASGVSLRSVQRI